ncbi:RNA polymerase sigma factor [Streptomyces sp. NPDC099050]|uniref:RNA polymerase sigma factor n=1 Tax=Streptomyces sp. NPDC099050 TaxID=3366100 RepID=UPI00380F3511
MKDTTNDTTRIRTGRALAALLAADGLVHLCWATGLTWPAPDARTLSLAVLGSEVSFGPPVVLPLAALTLTGAAAVLAHAHGRGGRPARLVTAAVAAGLAVRGLAGLGWAAGLLPTPADGPDATQEALLAVFRSLRTLRDPETLYGWVRSIAVREAVRTARRASRDRPAELADVPARDDPQLAADIEDVLPRLSPAHRAVLVLRDVEGLDEESAATLLGVPPGTAKSRLHRARTSFRKAWSA